jgi:hypothetical protein
MVTGIPEPRAHCLDRGCAGRLVFVVAQDGSGLTQPHVLAVVHLDDHVVSCVRGTSRDSERVAQVQVESTVANLHGHGGESIASDSQFQT